MLCVTSYGAGDVWLSTHPPPFSPAPSRIDNPKPVSKKPTIKQRERCPRKKPAIRLEKTVTIQKVYERTQVRMQACMVTIQHHPSWTVRNLRYCKESKTFVRKESIRQNRSNVKCGINVRNYSTLIHNVLTCLTVGRRRRNRVWTYHDYKALPCVVHNVNLRWMAASI